MVRFGLRRARLGSSPGSLQNTQPVSEAQLLDQRLAVLTRAHELDERLESCRVPDASGDPGAVEIGSEADAVLADVSENVLEVINHQLGGRVSVRTAVRTKKAGSEVNADKASRFADRRQLFVREISRMRAQGVRVRVRGDQGRIADGGNIPKSAFVEV